MFRNFLTNRLCHAPILRKECCYRIGRHLLLPPMDHGIEQRCLTVVILVGMEFVQILFAVLDCSVQQRHCTGFSSLTMQVCNWMFCVKTQVTDLHIEKLTASGSGIIHEDHEYKIPLVFLPGKIGLLKQRGQRRFGQEFNDSPVSLLGGNIAGRKIQ